MSNNTLAIQIIEITKAIPELGYDGTEGFVVELDGEFHGQYAGLEAAQQAASELSRAAYGFGIESGEWVKADHVDTWHRHTWGVEAVTFEDLADELGIEQTPTQPLSGADVLAGFCGHLARGTRVVSRREADEITSAWREHTTATAELVAINDERIEDGEVVSYDTISIVHGGETDTIEVESSEDRGDYEAAVREFLGADVTVTWLPDGF